MIFRSHRTVKSSSKLGTVSAARALSAAKRARDGRVGSKSGKTTAATHFKTAPALVKK